jgi:ABC-type nickel/cobalt efflux system permease component RcnA
VPKENHDRIIDVKLTPAAVVVEYHLEVDGNRAELDLIELELPPDEFAGLRNETAFVRTYIAQFAPILANNLFARLDGALLVFTRKEGKLDASVQDHLRFDFTFTAPWTPKPGRTHQFTFEEANYHRQDFNRIQLTLSAAPGVSLQSVTGPDKELLERSQLMLKSGDSDRLRKASATFSVGESALSPGEQQPETNSVMPDPSGDAEDDHPQKLLHLLLDTRRGVVVLLLLAAGFGAVHALTPGHGKTLVAAYLVGEHGTVWHALILGLMTTLTHTGAVFALAIVFFISPATASLMYFVQGLVGGLLIAGLGLWLLFQRLAGRADHFHVGGHSHHHHHHGHDGDHDHAHVPVIPAGTSVRWWHLVLLGMRGGIVPCWDAIILLCLAISAQRLWLGVPLLLAFSAGLASVLVALGVSVVWARNWAIARWGEGQRMRKLARALPLLSAALITALGLWLCYDSLHPATPTTLHSSRP